ncbi:MAG: hypothetical protein ACXVIJ_08840 [Thermoanaerobaculia bacterium]
MTKSFLFLMVVIALPGTASRVGAQNLLQNGNFDTDLSGWTDITFPPPVWTPDDCCANPDSGSVRLRGGGTFMPILASDCVAVTANSGYDVRTMVNMVPFSPGDPYPAGAALYVIWNAAPDCTGVEIDRQGILFSADPLGWHLASAHLVAPDGTNSAFVQLLALNGGLSSGINAYFDDVRFGPSGSVPVDLQSFTVD